MPAKIKLPLQNIIDFGGGVYKLDFFAEARQTRFQPGQFLHLALDDYDPTEGYWPESRVFSICSSPRSKRLSIVYSVKGTFTRRMEASLRVGNRYWLKLPYGDFVIESLLADEQTAVLVAGGTGISPFIPFIRKAEETGSRRRIRLEYGLRSARLSAFDSELQKALDSQLDLTVRVFTQDGTRAALKGSKVSFETGVLPIERIRDDVGSEGNPAYLLSGPPSMIAEFRNALLLSGVSAQNIKIDEWE